MTLYREPVIPYCPCELGHGIVTCMPCGSPVHLAPPAGIGDTVQIDYKGLSKYSLSVSSKLKDALSLPLIVRRIMCAEKVTKYNICSLICVLLYTRGEYGNVL